jgi:hypothetical protein
VVKEREGERAVQQFNGREGETATLLFGVTLKVKICLLVCRKSFANLQVSCVFRRLRS